MKKGLLSFLVFILFIFSFNIGNAFDVKQVSREQIDKIKCDLHFKGTLEVGYGYTFNDTFINNTNREVKVIESEVNVYEEEDFNQSNEFSSVNFSKWAIDNNKIFQPGDRGIITELNDRYRVKVGPKKTKQDNFIIKYTLGLYYKDSNGKFTDGPHYHTECKQYKVIGKPVEKNPICNGLKLDKNKGVGILTTKATCSVSDISKYTIDCGNGDKTTALTNKDGKGEIVKTCIYTKPGNYSITCSVDDKPVAKKCIQNVSITEEVLDEKYIKSTYKKYSLIENELNNIIREENTKGKKIIRLPEILPRTGTPISARVKKLNNNKLDLEIDKNRFILAGSRNTDINFWKKILDKKDQNVDKILVIPSNGLVIPINTIKKNTSDYNKIISGREIEVNKYLKTGSAEYPGTSINGYGEVGNKVIFGHSSYWKKDDGRYKTDFQKIIELDPDEEIWVYEKDNGKYKMYKYKVESSYNTRSDDIDVLNPGIGKNLTLITCTPIGGIAGRWVVKAKYIDDYKKILEKRLAFEDINLKTKIKIKNIINRIYNSPNGKRKILKIFNSIIKKESQLNKQKQTKKVIFIENILEYLKYRLAVKYYN